MGSLRWLRVLALVGIAWAGCSKSSPSNGTPAEAGSGGSDGGGNSDVGNADVAVDSGDGGGADSFTAAAGCPSSPDDLISDFASDNSVSPQDGRQGGWYTYGDDLGMFAYGDGYQIDTTANNPNCSNSGGSLHVKASGFADWGAAMGVDFKPHSSLDSGATGPKMTYDASKYRGVAFWMKSASPLDGVQVSFPDLNTDAASPPHSMMDSFDPTNKCDNCNCIYLSGSWQNCSPYLVQFGKMGDAGAAVAFQKYMDVQIGTDWQRFEVLFEDTRQDPGNLGYHTSDDKLDVAELTGMAIQVNVNYDTTPKSARDFEVWLDDVTFIK